MFMKYLKPFCLLAVCVFLTGCGFHSVYGARDDQDPVAVELNAISIDTIPERNGQILRNALIDRIYGKNRPALPLYHLKIEIHANEEVLGLLANATATRSMLNLSVDYTLTDQAGKKILTGMAHSVASYNRLDQMYGTVAARESAYDHTLHEASEQIVNRLSLYFSEKK